MIGDNLCGDIISFIAKNIYTLGTGRDLALRTSTIWKGIYQHKVVKTADRGVKNSIKFAKVSPILMVL